MQLSVNPVQRHAKMRAHTATHLLHALIAKLIPTTQQAGSLVDDDYVRFDYTSDEMLTPAQLASINQEINHMIWLGREVTTTEMNLEQALTTGAKAFFQDKYGDTVRVVQVIWDGSLTSVELCGGTHVSNTREIGSFVIVEQSPVASGTKRIVAYTWPKCYEYSTSLESNLEQIAAKLDCTPKQIDERLSKILKDYLEAWAKLESLTSSLVLNTLLGKVAVRDGYKIINLAYQDELRSLKLADIVSTIKAANQSVIVYWSDGWYAIVGWNAKAFAQQHWLKGGGSESLFQGKDEKITSIF